MSSLRPILGPVQPDFFKKTHSTTVAVTSKSSESSHK